MKLARIKTKGSKSLYGAFLYMTLLPLFLFGLIMIVYSSKTLSSSIQEEAANNLKNVGISVLSAFDVLYPGDYNIVFDGTDVSYYKGDHLLSGDYAFIDKIKKDANVEISLFFYDTRLMTTIQDKENGRFINTGANAYIVREVIEKKTPHFFNNVKINGVHYFAYYEPIFSQDGKVCLGMIGVGKTAEQIVENVNVAVYKNLAIMILTLLITSWFIIHFASKMVMVIKKMMDFLKDISLGNLESELDPFVVSREDELGEMGRLTMTLQMSLRKLIERDVLTGLYNRRSAENKLDEIRAKGHSFVIALGDIDFFKKFNDNFGHTCGDVVLKEVSRVLDDEMHGQGFVARWGGEEFLLVFENMETIAAGIATDKILQAVRNNKVLHEGREHAVTMTFGVAESQAEVPINLQIKEADEKLYKGKEGGRNRVVV